VCNGEKLDKLIRIGLLQLITSMEGLQMQSTPESLHINLPRLRAVQSQFQQVIVIATRAWAEVVGFRVATLWCLCVPAFRSLNSIHKNNKESVAGAASMVCAKRENFDSPPSLDNLNHVICDYLNRELRGIDKILVLVFLVSKIHWSCLHVHF